MTTNTVVLDSLGAGRTKHHVLEVLDVSYRDIVG